MYKIVLVAIGLLALNGCSPPIPNSAAHAKNSNAARIWGDPNLAPTVASDSESNSRAGEGGNGGGL